MSDKLIKQVAILSLGHNHLYFRQFYAILKIIVCVRTTERFVLVKKIQNHSKLKFGVPKTYYLRQLSFSNILRLLKCYFYCYAELFKLIE